MMFFDYNSYRAKVFRSEKSVTYLTMQLHNVYVKWLNLVTYQSVLMIFYLDPFVYL